MRLSLEENLKVLIGQSPRMLQLQRLIDKLGRCRWPVLVLGETGTGKEVVARSIHHVLNAVPPFAISISPAFELFAPVKAPFT